MTQEMMGWQWHQLDHMQIICSLHQTGNHASTPSLIFTGQMLFLTPNQQCQSTEGSTQCIIKYYQSSAPAPTRAVRSPRSAAQL